MKTAEFLLGDGAHHVDVVMLLVFRHQRIGASGSLDQLREMMCGHARVRVRHTRLESLGLDEADVENSPQ
jgi:hypothetical protein